MRVQLRVCERFCITPSQTLVLVCLHPSWLRRTPCRCHSSCRCCCCHCRWTCIPCSRYRRLGCRCSKLAWRHTGGSRCLRRRWPGTGDALARAKLAAVADGSVVRAKAVYGGGMRRRMVEWKGGRGLFTLLYNYLTTRTFESSVRSALMFSQSSAAFMENHVEQSLNIVRFPHAVRGASLRLQGRATPIRSCLQQALVFWPKYVTAICTLHLPRSLFKAIRVICGLYAYWSSNATTDSHSAVIFYYTSRPPRESGMTLRARRNGQSAEVFVLRSAKGK
ncbi:hypothetical protein KC352_g68 [Hortaea werneckii]|nr:hypothetical protein KC352_g68 [Hortaea werneckii]